MGVPHVIRQRIRHDVESCLMVYVELFPRGMTISRLINHETATPGLPTLLGLKRNGGEMDELQMMESKS